MLLVLPASAADWTVDQTGGADFSTLSDALAGCASGDRILLRPGTYSPSAGERLPYYFPSNIVIQGAGVGVSVLDAEGQGTFGRAVQPGVTLSGVTFRGARDTALTSGSGLALTDCAFYDNGGDKTAAVSGLDVTIQRCAFGENFVTDQNGAILALSGASILRAVSVSESMAAGQPLVDIATGGVYESTFSGGAVRADTITNSLVFAAHGQENSNDDGSCVEARRAINNTVVGCASIRAVRVSDIALSNLIANNRGTGLDAPYAAYNLLYDNDGGDFSGSDWTGQLENVTGDDPRFRAFSDDDDWTNDDVRLLADSPALDAAAADFPSTDIAGVPRPQDGDGDGNARADIGAYEWGEIDADGDGWFVDGGDCDDTNPEINPDVDDIPYNGIDEDCDGADLTDVDGDGYPADHQGGGDCDDTNAAIHPGAWDVPGNGIDEDCDGAEPVDTDGDGWPDDQDCAPEDAAIHFGATEVCDGVDNNCDGVVDDACEVNDGDTGAPDTAANSECACFGCRSEKPAAGAVFLPLALLLRRRRRVT